MAKRRKSGARGEAPSSLLSVRSFVILATAQVVAVAAGLTAGFTVASVGGAPLAVASGVSAWGTALITTAMGLDAMIERGKN